MSQSHLDEMPVPRALADAWRADRAWPGEVRRSYERFLRKRRAPPRSLAASLTRWVPLGILLGVGLAQAASLVPWTWSAGREQATRISSPTSKRLASAEPAPLPHVELAASAAPPVLAPTAAAERVAAPKLASSVVAPKLAPSAAAARMQARWQDAARALRADDLVSAEQALSEIELNTSGDQRDAARLARAQLLLSHGRADDAMPILKDLSEHATSKLVRDKALGFAAHAHEIDAARPLGSGGSGH